MNDIQYSARDVAVQALRDRAGNVSAYLDRLLTTASLSETERDFARELALGTVRRRGTLRAILRKFLTRPDKKLPAPLGEVLEVALYQLLFLERVPAFAVVNEAVEQAVRHRHKRQSGLVNGVLRGVTRALSDRIDGAPPLAADVVPTGCDSYRKMDRAIFADPASRPAEYLAEAFSLPLSLAGRWVERSGSLESAADLAMHTNIRAPVILRVNRLRASVEDVLKDLKSEGVEARAHENGCSVVLVESRKMTNLGVFQRGWVQVQDATATAVGVVAADPRAGMNVLDFCAAPGTKTTHLAELMDDRGSITAVDVSRSKLDKIETNCKRMGISIVSTCLADQVGGLDPKSFDLVLVDVPCSNTGVLARRAEARWRFDPQALVKLTEDQRALVELARQFVRGGGRMVYSTCSIEPEECGELAHRVRGMNMLREQLTLPAGADDPTRWCDGGYFAVFEA